MIHQYKLNGYNIVLDVYSGSVHAVDELAYAAIALVDAGHPRAEAADLLAKKEELDTIVESTSKEEKALQARRSEYSAKLDERTLSAYERIRQSTGSITALDLPPAFSVGAHSS